MKTKLTRLFKEFLRSEQASGVVLIACTIAAIAIANSPIGPRFLDLWHIKLGTEAGGLLLKHSIEHWINDGLMAVFFLMIGLEIERELYEGELSDLKNAALPVFAAIGGMVMPALLHFLFNRGTATQSGIGIPMATDIAFALGAMALLGNRVPVALKVFLAGLAIIDDLGAIIIIALFYAGDFSAPYFLAALVVFGGLLAMNRLGVRRLAVYLIPGVVMWYFMMRSGVHATIAGVLLAFAIPFRGREDEVSPSDRLLDALHEPVAFVIMPVFALANTGIALSGNLAASLLSPNSLGIGAGLLAGKPLGIILFSYSAIKLKLARLPNGVAWGHLAGAGCLAGIGFTMSIFITLLAFADAQLVQNSKIAILLSSFLAGGLGYLILRAQRMPLQTLDE